MSAWGCIQCIIVFVYDGFLLKIQTNASQEKLVRVGRIATVVMVIIGLLWIPVIQGARGCMTICGYTGLPRTPIFVVFFFVSL
jgi:SSS family solute:Na+ symporter